MALTISGGCSRTRTRTRTTTLYTNPTTTNRSLLVFLPLSTSSSSSSSSSTSSSVRLRHVAVSAKKLSYGRSESKNSRTNTTLKENEIVGGENGVVLDSNEVEANDDGFVMPDLPGLEKDFWEGEQWDTFGFVVQYLWAFGILFAVVACGIAVATYNEGATDFKNTPAYKESIGSQEALEEPEGSNSEVFESNPTEVAPSLED
ncbi:hypothetical protein ACFE04_006395 [Oxalis oulophora]